MSLLEVVDVDVLYGNVRAIQGVSLCVEAGQIVTLIGANGAGKSTTLNAISGVLPISRGAIRFKGQLISGLASHGIVRLGISQVPEGRRIFGKLTVSENISLGSFVRNDWHEIQQDRERVLELFPRLRERLRQTAGTLSGGEQQMLAMARALVARPALILLDEPSMGLAPMLVEQVFEIIKEINRQGVTILLVEQNAFAALEIADQAYVLASGAISLTGSGAELLRHEQVISAYLGEG
ncbi:ABC transporter ATP-binding protein [Mesorhizobium qingshengii]|uniref:Amino acid/amide ABC transporter ATP-binding protein 2, HAAT family (TC 3.A.1.4.-) n=1 Tax=Mesorhizobium qingshengii TaxID=1165689 RepID=A0A1G5Z921_9HYPH|nr:ABC transporter ATP-binding protein [Mesorhizobium qingshengii]SDA91378.1 amino acid/amide ABC transporter ATP-binding protein 2, HAAT family (TC 3.A.1.4.-) [Mesorhizobium qingshengii]